MKNIQFNVNSGKYIVPVIIALQWQIHILGYFFEGVEWLKPISFYIFLIGTGLALVGMIYFAEEVFKSNLRGATKRTRLLALIYGIILFVSSYSWMIISY